MFSNELWQKSGVSTYSIDQSIRFNDDDSAYMYRNVDAPAFGNKYTMSFWAKFTNSDDYRRIITFRDKRGSGYPFGFLRLEKSDDSSSFQLTIFEYDTAISSNYPVYVVSAMKFRDYAAWYHIVVSVDYTRSVADRCKLYVNGTQQTFSINGNSASSGTPQSQASGSGANYWQIGRLYGLTTYPADYYLAEIHVVDGNAYGPEFFGETSENGIWIPKEFTGSHGSGGFFIDGRDSSDLGDDESGNGNDFTTSGLASHDQVSDSPTNNFVTFNPLVASSDTFTYSNGNLKSLSDTNSFAYTGLTQAIKTGKYVIEFDVGTLQSSSSVGVGMCTLDYFTSNQASTTQDDLGQQSDAFLFRDNTGDASTRMFIENSSAITTNNPTLGANDRFFIYVDADNGKAWVGLYDSSASSTSIYGSDFDTVGNPATGANPTLSFTSGTEMMIFVQYYNGNGLTIENEPSKMTHSVVSGYNAINTKNLGS
tara:strand:- start:57 stop:1496 length:1440 start_codon:yes stop_codon:yes gene_type:complete